jgi:hypothetical protein
MTSRRFTQVDVFTTTPYAGNPVGVVLDAEELEMRTMQRFARWTDLSGTTFLLPAQDPTYAIKARFTVDQLADTWPPYFTMAEGCASPPACSATRCRRLAVADRTRNGATVGPRTEAGGGRSRPSPRWSCAVAATPCSWPGPSAVPAHR